MQSQNYNEYTILHDLKSLKQSPVNIHYFILTAQTELSLSKLSSEINKLPTFSEITQVWLYLTFFCTFQINSNTEFIFPLCSKPEI